MLVSHASQTIKKADEYIIMHIYRQDAHFVAKSSSRCTCCAAGCASPTQILRITSDCWKHAIASARLSVSSPFEAWKRCHSVWARAFVSDATSYECTAAHLRNMLIFFLAAEGTNAYFVCTQRKRTRWESAPDDTADKLHVSMPGL